MTTAALSELSASLLKDIGENHAEQMVTKWIDTGCPLLNSKISGRYDGGLPFGRMVEIFGESSTGKTALATKCMVEAQRMGGCAIFVDWERSFDVNLAKEFGLNTDRPYWIYIKPRTWEEGNMLAAKAARAIRKSGAISPDSPIISVFDSIASAIPNSVLYDAKGNEREIDSYNMSDTTALARVASTTLKVMAQYAEDFAATFVYLNQMRLKPGVTFGDPRTTPGGKAMEFYASARLVTGRQKIMDKVEGEKDKEFVGQNITIQVVKTKFTKPFQKTDLRLMYGDDGAAYFDVIASLLEVFAEKKLMDWTGQRFTWTDGKTYFKKALAEKLNAEPDGVKQLQAFLPPL